MRYAVLALLILFLLVTEVGIDKAAAENEESNWPQIISGLNDQVYRMPNNATKRRQLATAHNNFAVSLAGEGEWALAEEHLREAIRLGEDDASFRKNLASVYLSRAYEGYADRKLIEAQKVVSKAIELDPELIEAYILLGEIEYNSQDLEAAQAAWQQALKLNPSDMGLAERLDQVNEELPVEEDFGRLSQAYFDLRYEEHLNRSMGYQIRSVLTQARRVIGSDFSHWPKYKLVVLIYSGETFRALKQETPDWVVGQYDGKIRVPLPDHDMDFEMIKQIIYHEYTHAIVHDLTHGQCPIWLNEGLAEYEGMRHGKRRVNQLYAAASEDELIEWEYLDDSFSMTLPPHHIALAYQQSYSIVQYLVERYGFWRIRRILSSLGEGKPLSDVIPNEFHFKLYRLETNWRSWLGRFLGRTSS